MRADSHTNRNTLKVWLAIDLFFGGVMVFVDQPFLANVAFLVAGALVATVTQLVIEAGRRAEQERDLARALYEELVNRVARCVFDFEEPWQRWVDQRNCAPNEMNLLRLRKFMPVPPTIYPATAGQIALLKGKAPQAIIRFHAALATLRSDMETVANHCDMNGLHHVPPEQVSVLAERLRRTLLPGLEALKELSTLVEGYEQSDAEAIKDADRLFKHERAHLTLRQRIEYYVSK